MECQRASLVSNIPAGEVDEWHIFGWLLRRFFWLCCLSSHRQRQRNRCQGHRLGQGLQALIGVVGLGYWGPNLARNFAELFSDDERRALLAGVTVASIGPITAATAAEYGLLTDVMPSEYTIPALTRALVDYFKAQPQTRGRRPKRSA